MKLLMCNNFDKTALEAQYFQALHKEKGIEVDGFYHQSSQWLNFFAGKIVYRIYPGYFWKPLNRKLLKHAFDFKPDIILIFKGMDIYPETLQILRSQGIKLVNYNADHPFIYVSRGSGNQNVRNSIPLFDAHITYSEHIASAFRKKYPGIRMEVIPFGYELSNEAYSQFANEDEILRPCFVGYADKERALIIKNILDHGLEIDVYGFGWSNFFPNPSPLLRAYPSLKGLDYYKVLHKYRVQLNLFRGHNEDSHNMRSFEVPAAGGIMLAPDTKEHRKFFVNNSEIFLYSSLTQIPQMLKSILNLPLNQAEIIRKNARSRSVSSGYDYASRAKDLLKILRQL